MHRENIAGSGLCLYYNSLVMQFACFFFLALVTTAAYWYADLESSLCQPLGSCVLGDLQNHDCTIRSDGAMLRVVDMLNEYHVIHAVALAVCFVVTYLGSLYFA